MLQRLDVDPQTGLSPAEAERRLASHGPNLLIRSKRRSNWLILLDQLKSLLTVLLLVATALSVAFGDYAEAAAIMAVIVFNTAIGFSAEYRAITSMEALRKLGVTMTPVRRDGTLLSIPAADIVPGDIVRLESGDVVTADLRLIDAARLEADESLLTGESVPVAKSTSVVDAETRVADRANMAFKGTTITRGSGDAVAVSTGGATQVGQISELVKAAEDEITPLEKRLNTMSRQLMWVALGIAAMVLIVGVLSGRDPALMVKTGVALAIAAIPEGLPIVATLALARGMWRLAQRNALVRRLSAVETLGSVTVIFTDKTGTLTQNRMTVTRLVFADGAVEFDETGANTGNVDAALVKRAGRVIALCNNAEISDAEIEDDGVGDPMELALLNAAALLEHAPESLEKLHEIPFDPETRMMATLHRDGDAIVNLVKGAPEAILDSATRTVTASGGAALTEQDRTEWQNRIEEYAGEGLRILALADRNVDSTEDDAYEDLTFLGLVLMQDPPRDDARPAIEAAARAGIRVVMATGDNAGTAANIAELVGLVESASTAVIEGKDFKELESLSTDEKERFLDCRVFARVNPRQKLELVHLYQQAGHIVSMTGDGVNDAPALKKADIGVAMGLRGTAAAREASDVVLKDDAFASIMAAIRQGRVIFTNIRKFVLYLMSCNLSEVLVVAIGIASGLPLPLLPLQILFLNLVTDVFPALALGFGEGDRDVLVRLPRDPKESIMSRRHWYSVTLYGVTIAASVLGAFVWALNQNSVEQGYAGTVAFLTLAFAQMWHVFNMRSRLSKLFNNQMIRNPFIWAALVLCTGLILGAVYVSVIADVLTLVRPDMITWLVILGASLTPLLAGQLFKAAPALPGFSGTERKGVSE